MWLSVFTADHFLGFVTIAHIGYIVSNLFAPYLAEIQSRIGLLSSKRRTRRRWRVRTAGAVATELIHDFGAIHSHISIALDITRPRTEGERTVVDEARQDLTVLRNLTSSLSTARKGRMKNAGRCDVWRVIDTNRQLLNAIVREERKVQCLSLPSTLSHLLSK